MKKGLSKIITEPVVLFFVLGFILFITYTSFSSYYERQHKKITVTANQMQMLNQTFEKTWNRPPTDAETTAQVENLIKDEVYFKEAVAMGLDKSDPAVKRRLRQLIELMMDDFATVYPSEAQLNEYLQANSDKFREDPKVSFKHLYYPFERKKDAKVQLSNIRKGLPIDESKTGLLYSIPGQFTDESSFAIRRVFGQAFAESIVDLEMGKWQGPVESGYGWHLVFVDHLEPGYVPPLSEIWDVVEREWSVEYKKKKKEEQYEKMKNKYSISFEYAN